MNEAHGTAASRDKLLRGIAMRSGVIVSGLFFAWFFFSDDPTLLGLDAGIRLGLAVFFWAVASALLWLFFRKQKMA